MKLNWHIIRDSVIDNPIAQWSILTAAATLEAGICFANLQSNDS